MMGIMRIAMFLVLQREKPSNSDLLGLAFNYQIGDLIMLNDFILAVLIANAKTFTPLVEKVRGEQ